MKKITSIAGQELIHRSAEQLGSVWTKNSTMEKFPKKQGPFMFSGEGTKIPSSIVKVINSCQERLLISTQNLSDTSIIDAIANAVIQQGTNVYLLVDTQGFESMLSNHLCKHLLGEVLLRERKNRGIDVVLSDWHLPTKAGLLLSSPLDGTLQSMDKNWAMELSKTQIDEFSAHIQHEFWSESEGREVLSPEEARNPRPIAESPFALRPLNNQDHILRSHLSTDGDNSTSEKAIKSEKKWEWFSTKNSIKSLIILNGEAINVGNGAKNVLYSSPSGVEPSDGKFAHTSNSIHLAIGNETYLSGWDRSATGDWHSILRLNSEQAKAAKSLLQYLSENPEWVGHSNINLGNAGDKIILGGKEMKISDSQIQDLGIIHLDEMPESSEVLQSYKPNLIPPKDNLARECQFKWISAPPVPPKSSSKDELHKEWDDVRASISKRLNALNELNVVSKIPGFGRKAKELQKSIEDSSKKLTEILDSKTLSDLIQEVEKLTKEVEENLDAIKAAEDEEARKKLEDEQREEHKLAVDKAKASIKTLEPRFKEMNAELSALKKLSEKAEGVEKGRVDSDIEQLEPKIKELGAELSTAKEISTSKFEFKAPATLVNSEKEGEKSHKFLGDTRESKLDTKIPKDDLPEFGTLFKDGDVRYLAISDWDHVDQGRKDAKRLNATLCASREVLE
jgi:hypothetical protein